MDDSPLFPVEWAREVRFAVADYVGQGVRADDSLGCLIDAAVHYAPTSHVVTVTADLYNAKLEGGIRAIEQEDAALLSEVGWGHDPLARFGSWFRHVLVRALKAGANPERWPLGRLGARFRTVDKLVDTLNSEAEEAGLRNREKAYALARRAMILSGQYSDRTVQGR